MGEYVRMLNDGIQQRRHGAVVSRVACRLQVTCHRRHAITKWVVVLVYCNFLRHSERAKLGCSAGDSTCIDRIFGSVSQRARPRLILV